MKEKLRKGEAKEPPIAQMLDSFVDELDFKQFPFKAHFSLEPLANFWRQVDAQPVSAPVCAEKIIAALEDAPQIISTITDLEETYAEQKELIDLMMTAIVPRATSDTELVAIVPPFSSYPFFQTPQFTSLLLNEDGCYSDQLDRLNDEMRLYVQILYAYYYIVSKGEDYQLDLDFDDYTSISMQENPETGVTHYYRLEWDARFCQIKVKGKPKPLTSIIKKNLLSNLSSVSVLKDSIASTEVDASTIGKNAKLANVTSLKLLTELLPPENFEFHGFMIVRATEITNQHVLGKVTHELLEPDAIDNTKRFLGIQEMLRTVLRLSDVEATLIGIDSTDQVLMINSGRVEVNTPFSHISDLDGSQYRRALDQGSLLPIPDLPKTVRRKKTAIEKQMLEDGVGSLVIIPLYDPETADEIGILELRSPTKDGLNDMNAMRLYELSSPFSSAVKRWVTEREDEVEKTIRQQCTPIHQSVSWRFEKAARDFFDRRRAGENVSEMEPIIFNDVYPLYGQSDIRGSSEAGNSATQTDLKDQLTLAREILTLAYEIKPMPFLEDLMYRVDVQFSNIEGNLGAGDDLQVLEFLRTDVEKCFTTLESFKNYDAGIGKKIEAYGSSLDPQRRAIHRQRKEYDDSVSLINDTISSYVDREQEKAQRIFPHYFEKNVTDGVDHQIYVGESMLDKKSFDPMYLRNLRLWQLMVLCGSAHLTEQLKPSLNLKLDTAHLVAVQETQQTISFDYNEKLLAMKGSYDVRYEIMKKRIDKAKVKETGERLTQPGKIAIVYSQNREGAEYEEYLKYLAAREYLIDSEPDRLNLEDLQGLYSLKALRVAVNLNKPIELPGPEEDLSQF